MFVLLLATWLRTAGAAVPVELPSGEAPAAWAEAARLAGVQLIAASGAPSVHIVAEGSRWTVHVIARDGSRRTLVVAAPTTPAGREDLLATVVSLADPVVTALPTVALPPAPPPPPVRQPAAKPKAAVKPVTTAVPSPPVEPAPESTPTEPPAEQATPEAVASLDPPAPSEPGPEPEPPALETPIEPAREDVIPPPKSPFYARLSLGPVLRLDVAPTLGIELSGGLATGPVRVGLSVGGALPASLGDDRTMRAAEVAVVFEAGDRGPWGALRAGAALRGWSQEGEPVGLTVTPDARLDVGWGFVARTARIRSDLWAAADLAPTTLYVDGLDEGQLARAFFGIALGVEIFRSAD